MELHTQYAPVPALSRAALVLKAVFENGGLPAKDIARRCPCPKTTFYRLLAELVHSGYLYEDEQTKLYTPGPLFEDWTKFTVPQPVPIPEPYKTDSEIWHYCDNPCLED